MSQICVVFNNRRSGLFLQESLRQLGPESFFLPQTVGMDDIVHSISGLDIIQKEYLLFELYDIHRGLTPAEKEIQPFEQFISFGEMMLNDFSEIDLYMADVAQLFDNLYELKSIGEWDIGGAPLTPFQKNYLQFYRSLYDHYTRLHQRLIEQGKAYSGMAYRMAAEQVETVRLPYDRIYFVGFNALSKSEEIIIQTLHRQGQADLICDGDAYYYDQPEQEAGHFLRRLAKRFDTLGDYIDHFARDEKHITLVESPEDLMQAKYAGDLIRRLVEQSNNPLQELQNTALVLADESLLIPVLNSLPDNVGAVNVTMGYPLEHTAIHTLTLKLLATCKNMRRQQVHHRDLEDILSDTCIEKLIHKTLTRHTIRQYLYQRQQIFVDRDALQQLATDLQIDIRWLESLWDITPDRPDLLLSLLRQTAKALQDCNAFESSKKDTVSIHEYLRLTDHFSELQQRYGYIDRIDTFERIYLRMARRLSIPFYGKPLQGLQILGMLESRNLDFRRVILLSANEGILPAGRQENTLIPYNLKKAAPFHLPTHEEKDAIYANHFYRLLQRTEQAYIVFSTQTDSSGKGEASRFVNQLTCELVPTHTNIHIHKQIINPEIGSAVHRDKQQTHAPKTGIVVERLRQLATRGFSPSALNLYRSCPMQYYIRYVLRAKESDELSDSLDHSQFGTLVHSILHDLYATLGDLPLTTENLQSLLARADTCIDEHFAVMGTEHVGHGRTYLQRQIAREEVHHLLKNDIALIESGHRVQIVALEQPLEHTVVLASGETAKLIGTADRIDLLDGHLRIADYKTGKVEPGELNNTETNVAAGLLPDKSFQVLLYTWLYLNNPTGGTLNISDTKHMVSGIYPLGDLRADFMPLHWDGQPFVTRQQVEQAGQVAVGLVAQILDSGHPFEATDDLNTCGNCPVKATCPKHIPSNGPTN